MPKGITADISGRQRALISKAMKKIICIGECSLNIVLGADGQPCGSLTGGRIAMAATMMAHEGFEVLMASEMCADRVGDIVAATLTQSGVDVRSVDRFTEGRTPVNIFVQGDDGKTELTRYEAYPEEAFDIIWPRIDEDDIVVFGGYYALDRRMRQRMSRLLVHACERKAILVYLPGFLPEQETRITRVMPQLLENLEMATVVVSRNKDLKLIFGQKTPDECYHNHIDFYCRALMNVDDENNRITFYAGNEHTSVEVDSPYCRTMLWNAGAVAGMVSAIASAGMTIADLDTPGSEVRARLLEAAARSASSAVSVISHPWQAIE